MLTWQNTTRRLSCQKPCWDQARLSSLVNKQVGWGSAASSCRLHGVTRGHMGWHEVTWGHTGSWWWSAASSSRWHQAALAAPPSNLRCMSLLREEEDCRTGISSFLYLGGWVRGLVETGHEYLYLSHFALNLSEGLLFTKSRYFRGILWVVLYWIYLFITTI